MNVSADEILHTDRQSVAWLDELHHATDVESEFPNELLSYLQEDGPILEVGVGAFGGALTTSGCSMTLVKRRSKSSPSSRKSKRKPGSTRKGRASTTPRTVALAAVKDDFSKYLRLAAEEEIVITRHGRPAGVLIGFASEDDWFDYRLENHPEFLRRIADARAALREGRGVLLEES